MCVGGCKEVVKPELEEIVQPELEGKEGGAGALVELGLELDPVKSESVEEGGQALHQYWESNN